MSKETKKYIKKFLIEIAGNIALGLTIFLLFS